MKSGRSRNSRRSAKPSRDPANQDDAARIADASLQSVSNNARSKPCAGDVEIVATPLAPQGLIELPLCNSRLQFHTMTFQIQRPDALERGQIQRVGPVLGREIGPKAPISSARNRLQLHGPSPPWKRQRRCAARRPHFPGVSPPTDPTISAQDSTSPPELSQRETSLSKILIGSMHKSKRVSLLIRSINRCLSWLINPALTTCWTWGVG